MSIAGAVVAKPLSLITGVTVSIVTGYIGIAILAYVLAGGIDHPAAGRAAIDSVNQTALNLLPKVASGIINLLQAIGQAVMRAIQS